MGRRVSMFGRPEGDGRVREVRRLCIVMGFHTQILFIPTQLTKTQLSLTLEKVILFAVMMKWAFIHLYIGWNLSVLIVKKRCTKSSTGGSGYDFLVGERNPIPLRTEDLSLFKNALKVYKPYIGIHHLCLPQQTFLILCHRPTNLCGLGRAYPPPVERACP